MKNIMVSVVLAGMALAVAGASPSLAKTDCKKDISEFDAGVKTTTASKADVDKAMKLRDEANKDCTEKGGSAKGDADMKQALKLIGIK
jgi:hypothetical protein